MEKNIFDEAKFRDNFLTRDMKCLCYDCIKYNKCSRYEKDIKAVSCSLYWKKPQTIKEWLKWFYVHKIWSPYRYYKYHYLRDKLHII